MGDLGVSPGLGRSPGEKNGYPLHYSGLENSMDCIVHEVAKSWTRLSDFHFIDFPGGSDGKATLTLTLTVTLSACNAGDLGLIPGLGRSPGEKNGYPLQYSCLENSVNRGAWRATVHRGHKESDTTERLTLNTLGLLR